MFRINLNRMIKSRFFKILAVSYFLGLNAQAGALKCDALFSSGQYTHFTSQQVFQSAAGKSSGYNYQNYSFGDIPKARTYIIPTPEIKGAISFSLESIKRFEAEIDLNPTERALLNAALHPSGYMGYASSLGPAGTINKWGPVGTSIVNPSHLISGFDWSAYAKIGRASCRERV